MKKTLPPKKPAKPRKAKWTGASDKGEAELLHELRATIEQLRLDMVELRQRVHGRMMSKEENGDLAAILTARRSVYGRIIELTTPLVIVAGPDTLTTDAGAAIVASQLNNSKPDYSGAWRGSE